MQTMDESFEFDAPRYCDFTSEAPESPSRTDAWFDSLEGSPANGIMSPELGEVGTARARVESLESHSESKGCEPEQGAKEKYAAVLMPPASYSSTGLSSQALARPKVPANLVTSWSSSAAQRVLTCLTNQEPGPEALAESPQKLGGKRTGFITPRRPKENETQEIDNKADEEGDPSKEFKRRRTESCKAEGTAKKQRIDASKRSKVTFVEGKRDSNDVSSRMPRFETSSRARPPRYKGRAQMEEEAMAAMPKFKANPIRYSNAVPGRRHSSPATESSRHAPNSALETSKGARKQGLYLDLKHVKGAVLGPRSAIDQPSSSQPKERHSPGLTEPKPFNLLTELRGRRAKMSQHEANRLAEETEVKPHNFHAQPVPKSTYTAPVVMHPANPVFTMPEPFNLESEKRHEEAQERQELLALQEEERRRQEAHFKARSKPNGEAFQVKRSDRYLTVPDDVVLHGEERSRRRAEFDAAVGEKERRQKEEEAAAEAERLAKEAQEIKELRRKQQFKARPMPEYKAGSYELNLPPLHWTEPVSPKLSTEARAIARARHDANL